MSRRHENDFSPVEKKFKACGFIVLLDMKQFVSNLKWFHMPFLRKLMNYSHKSFEPVLSSCWFSLNELSKSSAWAPCMFVGESCLKFLEKLYFNRFEGQVAYLLELVKWSCPVASRLLESVTNGKRTLPFLTVFSSDLVLPVLVCLPCCCCCFRFLVNTYVFCLTHCWSHVHFHNWILTPHV